MVLSVEEWKMKIMVAEINVPARTLEKKKVFVSSNSSGAPYWECHTKQYVVFQTRVILQ